MLGLEVAWAIGIAALLMLLLVVKQPIDQFGWSSWDASYSFILTAVPLFVFMGAILGNTGICEMLFNALEKWLGRLPGGLACSTIAACGVFAAMSGSGMAATAAFGKVAFPPMDKRHYSPRLSLSSIAIGSTLAPLIPPSVLLIIYGAWVGTPITRLFAAALMPGVLLVILYMVTVLVRAKLNPSLAPSVARYSWREKLLSTKDVLPFVLLIVGVLGTIFGGVMTPTEAASMGAFLSLILTLVYRRLNVGIIKKSLLEALKVTAMGMFIFAMAVTLTHTLNMTGITSKVVALLLSLNIGVLGWIAIFTVMYLFLGMLFDAWSMLFLTFPFVIPIVNSFGVDLVWFAVFFVIISEFGLVTPPFGLSLYVLRSIVPEHSIETVSLGALPYIIPVLSTLALITAFPEVALWLPGLLYK